MWAALTLLLPVALAVPALYEHGHDKRALDLAPRHNDNSTGNGTTTYRYRTDKTEKYLVTSLPDVDIDFGELYSGEVQIDTDKPDETLFFFFKPRIGDPVDEVTIWLNGGPGCSSLEGFFAENGPIFWAPGQSKATFNQYNWANLTNMLWVEQPRGVGYSQGVPNYAGEEPLAEDFAKWFKNWQDTFGIKNYKVYVTGESYAGRYVPYISANFLDKNDTENFDLQGALVYDPCIGDYENSGSQVSAFPLVQANRNLFNFNDTYYAEMERLHHACGYDDWFNKYLQFPPPGNQPPAASVPEFNITNENSTCDVFDAVYYAANEINPCFNIYEIAQMCPMPFDPLTDPDLWGTPYFNRTDVKKAVHAPESIVWNQCPVRGTPPVFPKGDASLDPIQHVLPQVIEATNRVLVSNGDFDMILITNGTLLAIQNMTWGGQLGFQSAPTESFVVDYLDEWGYRQGVMGKHHYERGLMWVETYQAGHMQPMYQPRAAYRHLEWVLGRIDKF